MATITAPHAKAAAEMSEACNRLLESLDAGQKERATYPYLDAERVFWYFAPINRHGLPLRDMTDEQRKLANAVMATGLTDSGYKVATQIIEHEAILGPLEVELNAVTWPRDTTLYFFTIFGEPGGSDPWGWRVEGHHVSMHFSIWNDKVISVTPLFLGINPAEVRKGPHTGLRVLGPREDLAIELMNNLDAGQRSTATIFDKAPPDVLTFSAARASMPYEQGLQATKMNATQREILTSLVAEYTNSVRADVSQERLDSLKDGGLDALYLAWGGPAKAGEPHYYRIHGGDFVIEYDNRQNGANHIHSVWRYVMNDFATDVLRDHLLLYHVL
ncbi:MAG: DUF3500 domain-containing protein [Chloroflexi bacterium]|nr:DUF3500 domain-containing protein [Chloroflexota bacterium]MDA1226632.1 DUF3500 domain-containing protein [Chloroflexota bacterium]